MTLYPSAYECTLLNTYVEMIDREHTNTSSDEKVEITRELDDNLEMIIPAYPTDNLYKLAKELKNFTKNPLHYVNDSFSYSSFSDAIFSKLNPVVELGSRVTIKEAFIMARELIKEDKDGFFGMLLIDSNTTINILHPLVAVALADRLLDPNDILHKSKYRAVIFSTPTSNKTMNEFKHGNIEVMRDNIAMQLMVYADNSKMISKSTVISNVATLIDKAENRMFNDIIMDRSVEFDKSEFNQNGRLRFTAIAPVYMGVYGIAFPWYGSVFLYSGSPSGHSTTDTYASNISPFLSANIGHSYRSQSNDNLIFDSVCTGKLDRMKIESCKSLNRSNFDSALCGMAIETGWFDYKNVCIEASVEILSDFFQIKDKPKNLSYKDQWILDNSATVEEYLYHLKNKLSGVEEEPTIVETVIVKPKRTRSPNGTHAPRKKRTVDAPFASEPIITFNIPIVEPITTDGFTITSNPNIDETIALLTTPTDNISAILNEINTIFPDNDNRIHNDDFMDSFINAFIPNVPDANTVEPTPVPF